MPEARRPFEAGCHDMPLPAAAARSMISGVVWMKWPKISDRPECIGLRVPLELGTLQLDLLARLEEVRLVDDAEPTHGLDLELRGVAARRPLHGAEDRRAEHARRVGRGVVGDRGGEALEDFVVTADRDIHPHGVDVADAAVGLGISLPQHVIDVAQHTVTAADTLDHRHPAQARVGEVEGGRHTVGEKVERAVKTRPVDVLGARLRGETQHRVAPAIEGRVDPEPAQAAREEMTVG